MSTPDWDQIESHPSFASLPSENKLILFDNWQKDYASNLASSKDLNPQKAADFITGTRAKRAQLSGEPLDQESFVAIGQSAADTVRSFLPTGEETEAFADAYDDNAFQSRLAGMQDPAERLAFAATRNARRSVQDQKNLFQLNELTADLFNDASGQLRGAGVAGLFSDNLDWVDRWDEVKLDKTYDGRTVAKFGSNRLSPERDVTEWAKSIEAAGGDPNRLFEDLKTYSLWGNAKDEGNLIRKAGEGFAINPQASTELFDPERVNKALEGFDEADRERALEQINQQKDFVSGSVIEALRAGADASRRGSVFVDALLGTGGLRYAMSLARPDFLAFEAANQDKNWSITETVENYLMENPDNNELASLINGAAAGATQFGVGAVQRFALTPATIMGNKEAGRLLEDSQRVQGQIGQGLSLTGGENVATVTRTGLEVGEMIYTGVAVGAMARAAFLKVASRLALGNLSKAANAQQLAVSAQQFQNLATRTFGYGTAMTQSGAGMYADSYSTNVEAFRQAGVGNPEEAARSAAAIDGLVGGAITGVLMKAIPGGAESALGQALVRAPRQVTLKSIIGEVSEQGLRQAVRNPEVRADIARVGATIGLEGLGEAAEESLDSAISGLYSAARYNPDMTWGEWLKDVGVSAALGGVMGGAVNTAVSATTMPEAPRPTPTTDPVITEARNLAAQAADAAPMAAEAALSQTTEAPPVGVSPQADAQPVAETPAEGETPVLPPTVAEAAPATAEAATAPATAEAVQETLAAPEAAPTAIRMGEEGNPFPMKRSDGSTTGMQSLPPENPIRSLEELSEGEKVNVTLPTGQVVLATVTKVGQKRGGGIGARIQIDSGQAVENKPIYFSNANGEVKSTSLDPYMFQGEQVVMFSPETGHLVMGSSATLAGGLSATVGRPTAEAATAPATAEPGQPTFVAPDAAPADTAATPQDTPAPQPEVGMTPTEGQEPSLNAQEEPTTTASNIAPAREGTTAAGPTPQGQIQEPAAAPDLTMEDNGRNVGQTPAPEAPTARIPTITAERIKAAAPSLTDEQAEVTASLADLWIGDLEQDVEFVVNETPVRSQQAAPPSTDAPQAPAAPRLSPLEQSRQAAAEAIESLPDTGSNRFKKADLRNALNRARTIDDYAEIVQAAGGGSIMLQGPKGKVTFAADATKATIKLFETADASTIPHEIAHVLRRFVLDPTNPNAVAAAERRGITREEIDQVAEWAGAKDGQWNRKAEEKFARGWEKYLRDFKAPVQALQPVFDKLAQWLNDIYARVRNSPLDRVEITDAVRAVFDKLAAGPQGAAETVTAPATTTEAPAAAQTTFPDTERTALKNEAMDETLRRLGFDPLVKPEGVSDQAAIDEAKATLADNPDAGKELIEKLMAADKPTVNVRESAILLMETTRRKLAHARASRDLAEVAKTGDPTAMAEARAKVEEAREAVYQAAEVDRRVGSEQGAAFRFRQVALENDYSLAAMEVRFRNEVNNGAPLTEEQVAKVAEMSDKLRKAEAQAAVLEEANEALRAGNEEQARQLVEYAETVAKLTKDVEKAQKRNKLATSEFRKKVASRLKPKAEAARQRLAAKGLLDPNTLLQDDVPDNVIRDYALVLADWMTDKTLDLADATVELVRAFGDRVMPYAERIFNKAEQIYHETAESVRGENAPTSDEVLATIPGDQPLDRTDVWNLARAHVIAGKRGRDVLDAVFSDLVTIFPDTTREEVAKVFTDYGRVFYPSQKEVPKELNKARTIERIGLKLIDVLNKRLPQRTGFQRGEQDVEVREAERQFREEFRKFEDEMREQGIELPSDERRLKSALEATKRRMANEIEEIQRALDSKTPRTTTARAGVTLDEEATKMRAELERLRQEYNDTFNRERSDEQRAEAALKALDRRIAEEQRMLEEGVLKRPANTPISTPEIEARRQQLAELRQRRRDLYEAQNPGETALEQAKATARRAIERLTEMVKTGDVATRRREPVEPDAELAALLEVREALADEVAEMRRSLPLTPEQEKAQVNRALEQAERTLARIEGKLASGDLSIEQRPPTAASQDPQVRAVRARIKELNKELARARRAAQPKKDPLLVRLERYVAMAQRKVADYQRRIDEKDFSPLAKKVEPLNHPLAREARLQMRIAKGEFLRLVAKEQWDNQPFVTKALKNTYDLIFRAPREVVLGLDAGGIGRQASFINFGRPSMLKNWSKHFKWSEENADRAEAELEALPAYQIATESGVEATSWRPGASVKESEEGQRSRLAKKVPGIAGSNRGYVTFMNWSRVTWFDALHQALLKSRPDADTEANRKALADFVNMTTGRPNMGRWANSSVLLSDIFAAPRWAWSRFTLIGGFPKSAADALTGWRLGPQETKAARKIIAMERARQLVGLTVVLSVLLQMAELMFPDEEVTLSLDTNSSDFGKIKIGDFRLDVGGGAFQAIVFTSQLLSGKKVGPDGEITHLTGPEKAWNKSRWDLIERFLRGRANPPVGAAWSMFKETDYMGEPVYKENEMIGLYVPLPVSEIYESYKKMGFAGGTAAATLNYFGLGSNTYGPETEALYDSSATKDFAKAVLFPVLNTSLIPFDKEVNPYRYDLPPSEPFLIPKDEGSAQPKPAPWARR